MTTVRDNNTVVCTPYTLQLPPLYQQLNPSTITAVIVLTSSSSVVVVVVLVVCAATIIILYQRAKHYHDTR